MKRNSKLWIIVGVLAVIALVMWLFSGRKKKEEVTFETVAAAPATIRSSITATGTIEPVTEVTVGTQVSGIVSKLYVDYNSVVKKGQIIAELDKTNLISQLNTAKANLQSAISNMKYQTANYKRYKNLYDKGLVSADEFEVAQLSYKQAKEQVASSKEEVNRAETNLGYATITSPIDGVVLSKAVEEGQTVAASFSTPELFTIAQDLTDMRVIADVDEADIGNIKNGNRVSFTVDAFPDDTFSGIVTQVRQEATTTNNVVTYEVVISAPNSDLKLKPGLTANVTIYTAPGCLSEYSFLSAVSSMELMVKDHWPGTVQVSPILYSSCVVPSVYLDSSVCSSSMVACASSNCACSSAILSSFSSANTGTVDTVVSVAQSSRVMSFFFMVGVLLNLVFV